MQIQKMLMLSLISTIFSGLLGCENPKKIEKIVQAQLEQWFPMQYEVSAVVSAANEGNMNFKLYDITIQDKSDKDIKIQIKYDSKSKGSEDFSKEQIVKRFSTAKQQVNIARSLYATIKSRSITDLSIGLNDRNLAFAFFSEISDASLRKILSTLYESIVIFDESNIREYSLVVKIYNKAAIGQRFTPIMEKQYIKYSDTWDNEHLLIETDIALSSVKTSDVAKFIESFHVSTSSKWGDTQYNQLPIAMDAAMLKEKESYIAKLSSRLNLDAENLTQVKCTFDAYQDEAAYKSKKASKNIACKYDVLSQKITSLNFKNK